MLAVFERLGIDLVARVLGSALERPELELVTYRPQPGAGGNGVPDGEMRGSFRFLFEVKTAEGQMAGKHAQIQLERHLKRLTADHATELVVALTPDPDPPPTVTEIDDSRLAWCNFDALGQALTQLIEDPDEPASEQQRFLLRELLALFELDGLIGGDDVVIVAAGDAYGIWRDYGAYVCQARRTFRRVRHWGFYRAKRIEPEFPLVRARYPEIEFSADEVARLQASKDPFDREVGSLVQRMLEDGVQHEGAQRGVYLLQAHNDPLLTRRDGPVVHPAKGAWTQQQRYARLEVLLEADTTADLA